MRVLLPVNPGDRFRYVSGEIKPSEVMAHVLGRLGDPDQTGVWISTVAPDADPADAVIVAVPLPAAITTPAASTVATELALVVQVTVTPVMTVES